MAAHFLLGWTAVHADAAQRGLTDPRLLRRDAASEAQPSRGGCPPAPHALLAWPRYFRILSFPSPHAWRAAPHGKPAPGCVQDADMKGG